MTTAPHTAAPAAARCTPKGRTVALPVLGADAARPHGAHSAWQAEHPKIKHSRVGRWRAAVLVLVHVLMAAHIAHWLITGMTVSPVEPSESIQTFRDGLINTGFVFFMGAILATAILGRWFCGWACHIVALQDLCSWIMARVRVKPKPFRSRLLVWVPLIVALYMFVWPMFHREVVRPLLMDAHGNLPRWLGQNEPLDALRTEFVTTDFWATFAPWYIAIPFILVCTFGVVYFLGSKGYCTYACPYGGFFGPADLVAPGKIRVTDACEGCGHCTAVCTSNVRVHEEVRDFGMVVDPGCMKCFDCVSVCPNGALYFGFGRPSLGARPKRAARLTDDEAAAARARARADRAARYDLDLWEEWAVAALFLLYFLAFRGMAHAVPMLMALGMAGIAAFCTWKLWSLARRDSARLQSLQLKVKGRLTGAGRVFILGTIVTIAAAAWSGYVRFQTWRADALHGRLDVPLEVMLRPEFEASPREKAIARRAVEHFRRAGPPRDGGIGWPLSPDELVNLAYLHAVLGEFDRVESLLREVIVRGKPRDALVQQAAQLVLRRGGSEADVLALYTDALARHDRLDGVRAELAAWHLSNNRRAEAEALWEGRVAQRHVAPPTLLGAARFQIAAGRRDAALALIDRAVSDKHATADTFLVAAGQMLLLGERARAAEFARRAAEFRTRRGGTLVSAAGVLLQAGDADAAAEKTARAVDRARALGPHTARIPTMSNAAGVYLQLGRVADAKALIMEAADMAGPAPWAHAGMAGMLYGYATQTGDAQAAELALDLLRRARDERPDAPIIRSDLAMVNFALGRNDDALAEMRVAVERSEANPVLPARLAELLRALGRSDEAARWEAESARRAAAAGRPAGPSAPPAPAP